MEYIYINDRTQHDARYISPTSMLGISNVRAWTKRSRRILAGAQMSPDIIKLYENIFLPSWRREKMRSFWGYPAIEGKRRRSESRRAKNIRFLVTDVVRRSDSPKAIRRRSFRPEIKFARGCIADAAVPGRSFEISRQRYVSYRKAEKFSDQSQLTSPGFLFKCRI